MRNAVLTMSLLLALGSSLGSIRAAELDPFATAGDSDPYVTPAGYNAGPLVETPENVVYDESWVESKSWFAPRSYGSYFQGEALWMTRAHSVSETVAVTLPPASQPVLNANDAQMTNKWRLGMLLTVGRQYDEVSSFELTYFGLNSWRANAGVSGPGTLSINGPLANVSQDYIFASQIDIDYSSTFNNAEANYKQTIEGLTLLAGFRYFNLDEQFILSSTRPGFGTSDYKIRATNNLIGGQIGAGFTQTWGRFTAEALAKGGVFGNLAHQDTEIRDFNNTFLRRSTNVGTTATAVMCEAVASVSYQVFDWLVVRAGYRFIWLNNIALAPDQLDFTNLPQSSNFVDANNHLFLQGASAGAEVRW